MRVGRSVEYEAVDRRQGMTLSEMTAFVREANEQGISGSAIIRIDSTWRSSAKKVRVEDGIAEAKE